MTVQAMYEYPNFKHGSMNTEHSSQDNHSKIFSDAGSREESEASEPDESLIPPAPKSPTAETVNLPQNQYIAIDFGDAVCLRLDFEKPSSGPRSWTLRPDPPHVPPQTVQALTIQFGYAVVVNIERGSPSSGNYRVSYPSKQYETPSIPRPTTIPTIIQFGDATSIRFDFEHSVYNPRPYTVSFPSVSGIDTIPNPIARTSCKWFKAAELYIPGNSKTIQPSEDKSFSNFLSRCLTVARPG